MDELVDVNELAKQAGVSTKTLRAWIAQERIDTVIRGDRRRRYVQRVDAERLLAPRFDVRRVSTAPAKAAA